MSVLSRESVVDEETEFGTEYDELLECSFCRYHLPWSIVSLVSIRIGTAEGRPCRAVWLDAFETWNEVSKSRIEHLSSVLVHVDVTTTRAAFTLTWNVGTEQRWARLGLYRSSDTVVTLAGSENLHIGSPMSKWARSLPAVRLLGGDTSSVESLNTLELWIKICNRDHSCAHLETRFIPNRLIQITETRLYLREGLVGNLRYACLSHCWGAQGLDYKLTKANEPDFCLGFANQDLPKTFQDAVNICPRLDLQFLWIDALCIVQDNIEDWSQTAATMAEIYRHAYITIAATASSNSSEGCFRKASATSIARPLRRVPSLLVRERRWPDRCNRKWVFDDDWIIEHPLFSRAWVFQERRMSPRMVHFTSSQLVWECRHNIKSEDGVVVHKKEHENRREVPEVNETRSQALAWQQIVAEYSALKLSFEQDRLPAIAALAAEGLAVRQTDKYLAGMGKKTLLYDLLWCRSSTSGLEAISSFGERPKTHSPSWSWSSFRGQVCFFKVVPLPSVQITKVTYIPEGPPHVGRYSEASITLRGPLVVVSFGHPWIKAMISDLAPCDPLHSSAALSQGICVCGDEPDYNFLREAPCLDELFFLFVSRVGSTYQGLILKRRSTIEYERVGICVCYHEDSSKHEHTSEEEKDRRVRAYIESLPVQEVTIV